MHTHSLAAYVECIDRNDWEGVADLMLDSASKLKNAGADFLICPDNTIHQAMNLVEPQSPLPWLHIPRSLRAMPSTTATSVWDFSVHAGFHLLRRFCAGVLFLPVSFQNGK